MKNRTLIFISTYNEVENVREIYQQISNLSTRVDFLFIDDASVDGTKELLDGLAKSAASVSLIHRPKKEGIGSAHRAGIDFAYEKGYTTLITMDCDLSHLPQYIPQLIEQSSDCDVVIASRYLKESNFTSWRWPRRFLAYLSHFSTAVFLSLPYDATTAFRLYRLDKIPQSAFTHIRSSDYAFFFESLYFLKKSGASIKEIPVVSHDRKKGHSKMTALHLLSGLYRLLTLAINNLRG